MTGRPTGRLVIDGVGIGGVRNIHARDVRLVESDRVEVVPREVHARQLSINEVNAAKRHAAQVEVV